MRPRNPVYTTLVVAVIALALVVPAIVVSGGGATSSPPARARIDAAPSAAPSAIAVPDAALPAPTDPPAAEPTPVESDPRAEAAAAAATEQDVRPLRDLSLAADRLIGEREGRVSVVVRDLRAGLTFARDGERRHVLASITKLPIALAAIERAQESGEPLPPAYRRWLRDMITLSDNWATVALLDYIGGGEAMRAFFSRLGLTDLSRFFFADDWGESVGNAGDVAAMFTFLATGEGLDARARARAFGLLDDVILEQRWGVSAGLAEALPGWTVSLKNGWFPVEAGWRVHSAGVVRDDRDRPRYVIVVLSSEQPSFEYGQDGIQRIATALYAALAARG